MNHNTISFILQMLVFFLFVMLVVLLMGCVGEHIKDTVTFEIIGNKIRGMYRSVTIADPNDHSKIINIRKDSDESLYRVLATLEIGAYVDLIVDLKLDEKTHEWIFNYIDKLAPVEF